MFLNELRLDLEAVYSLDLSEFSFPLDLWVRAVYLAIGAFSADHDLKVLDALRVLWQGRFLSLVSETEAMSDDEAEAYIQGQLKAFQALRSMLF